MSVARLAIGAAATFFLVAAFVRQDPPYRAEEMSGIVVELPDARREIALRHARAGDETAFEALVAENESMVFSIALHALRSRELAEEIAQEVFLRLYRNLPEIESPAHLVGWLRRTTTNRCIDELRKRPAAVVPIDDLHGASTEAEQPDTLLHARLRNLVAFLPEKQRLAVILRYQEGLEPHEISTMVDLPVNTVKSHLRRALATLRSHLGLDGAVESKVFRGERR
jgi:RNA polymerase sigma-70 factor, ECF subfamily